MHLLCFPFSHAHCTSSIADGVALNQAIEAAELLVRVRLGGQVRVAFRLQCDPIIQLFSSITLPRLPEAFMEM